MQPGIGEVNGPTYLCCNRKNAYYAGYRLDSEIFGNIVEYCKVLDFEAVLRLRGFWVLESNGIYLHILPKYVKDMLYVH